MTDQVEPLDEAFGEYVLQRRLGEGGMAVTYVARERISDIGERLVAIKQILPQFSSDEKFRQMFYDEVRVSSLLNHRNICRTYRAGEIGDKLYMTMEFVDGLSVADLRHCVEAHGEQFPVEHALYLVSEVLEGLHAAHTAVDANGLALDLVHRDVSPQNILVSRKGEVKIIDFGVAKAASNMSKTKTGAVKGKILYLSTEQLQAKPLDGRSDIFSVGLMLYELLTQEHPFEGPDEHATIYNYCTRDIVAPTQVAPHLPAAVDAPVMSALRRERDERFPDAQAAARAFTDVLYTISPQYRPYHFSDFVTWALSTNPGPLPALVPTGSALTGPGVAGGLNTGPVVVESPGPSASSPGQPAAAALPEIASRRVGGSNAKLVAVLVGLVVVLAVVIGVALMLLADKEAPENDEEVAVADDEAEPGADQPTGERDQPPVDDPAVPNDDPEKAGASQGSDDQATDGPAPDDGAPDDDQPVGDGSGSAWGYGPAPDDHDDAPVGDGSGSAWGYGPGPDDDPTDDPSDDGEQPSAWGTLDDPPTDDDVDLPAWVGTPKTGDPTTPVQTPPATVQTPPATVQTPPATVQTPPPSRPNAGTDLELPPEVENQLSLFFTVAPELPGTRIETMYRIMMYAQVDVAVYMEHFARFCRELRTAPWTDAEQTLLDKHFGGQDPCVGFNTTY